MITRQKLTHELRLVGMLPARAPFIPLAALTVGGTQVIVAVIISIPSR